MIDRSHIIRAVHIHRMMSLYMHLLFAPEQAQDILPGYFKPSLELLSTPSAGNFSTTPVAIARSLPFWDISLPHLRIAWDAACLTDCYIDDILKMRYLEHCTFSVIGDELALSERTVAHKHRLGTRAFLSHIPTIDASIAADRYLQELA